MSNMPKGIAIQVSHVTKDFKLPKEKVTSIKSLFMRVAKGEYRHKGFETQHALRDITFDVKEGEFFGIVGRNGSGKSTLLKILAQIYQPSSGTVQHAGKLVPFIELGVGFNPELTGRENVYLNGAMLGFSNAEVDKMYDEIVQFAELEEFMDQKLKNYSSGMQVRLAFSVATRSSADVLLVDEVLAVGDADFQRKCFNYFRSLKKNKKTVIFVSHDMNAVREYCDRAVLIENSRIIRSGKVSDVASAYTKMFIEDTMKESSEQKIGKKRWGDERLKYEGVKIEVETRPAYQEEGLLTFTAKFNSKADVDSPVFGLTVRNSAGTEMFGINNTIARVTSSKYRAGEKGMVTWKVNNILNDGDYTIDITIIDPETRLEIDWWEDAKSFSVMREEHTPFIVEPWMRMEIK